MTALRPWCFLIGLVSSLACGWWFLFGDAHPAAIGGVVSGIVAMVLARPYIVRVDE